MISKYVYTYLLYVVPHFKMVLLNEFASALCFVRKYHTTSVESSRFNDCEASDLLRSYFIILLLLPIPTYCC